MSDNLVTLKFTGGGEGPISFTANGIVYLASSVEYLYLAVPPLDADILLKTGYFVKVKAKKIATPKKAKTKKVAEPKKVAVKKVAKK